MLLSHKLETEHPSGQMKWYTTVFVIPFCLFRNYNITFIRIQ